MLPRSQSQGNHVAGHMEHFIHFELCISNSLGKINSSCENTKVCGYTKPVYKTGCALMFVCSDIFVQGCVQSSTLFLRSGESPSTNMSSLQNNSINSWNNKCLSGMGGPPAMHHGTCVHLGCSIVVVSAFHLFRASLDNTLRLDF